MAITIFITAVNALIMGYDIRENRDYVLLFTAENMGTISNWDKDNIFKDTELSEYHYHSVVHNEDIEVSDYDKRGLRVRFHIKNPSDEDSVVELPLTAYPGYVAESDPAGALEIAKEHGSHGDILLKIPAKYDGRVYVHYKEPLLCLIMDIISLASVLGLIVWVIYTRVLRQKMS